MTHLLGGRQQRIERSLSFVPVFFEQNNMIGPPLRRPAVRDHQACDVALV
jgi:hypothetical protein